MAKLLAAKRPCESMPDFAMGIDLDGSGRCSARAGSARKRRSPAQLFRFRTDAFVEPPAAHRDLPPLQLYRGIPPAPKLSARGAARRPRSPVAHYLVAHLAPNGRYVYEHDLTTGGKTDPTARRARTRCRATRGTTYFLARALPDHEGGVAARADRARVRPPRGSADGRAAAPATLPDGTEFDCVLDKGEHDRAARLDRARRRRARRVPARDRRHALPAARDEVRRVRAVHAAPTARFATSTIRRPAVADDKSELLYYSGEAALALARMYIVTQRSALRGRGRAGARLARPLVRLLHGRVLLRRGALDVHRRRGDLAGGAEADVPRLLPRLRRVPPRSSSPSAGEHPDEDDFAGAYNVTPFVPPYNTPAGSRTEAMISAYLLGVHHGVPDGRCATRSGRRCSTRSASRSGPRTTSTSSGGADGGMPGSPIDRNVRIDYRPARLLGDDPRVGVDRRQPSRSRSGSLLELGTGGRGQEDPAGQQAPGRRTARRGGQQPIAPDGSPTGMPASARPSQRKTSYLPQNDDPLIGTTLAGRYTIAKKLGEGGMGAVYLATHNVLEKQVALKVLHGEFARKPDLVERFMQEAKAASRIRHENVIDISDFGATPEGMVFFAMELLKGHDLHDEIARARLAGQLLPWARTQEDLPADLRGAVGGARERHRPPRSQARERLPRRVPRRSGLREAARLRHREADRGERGRRPQADEDRHAVRHARVHVAGAGARRARSITASTSTRWAASCSSWSRTACRSRPTTSWACCRCT